MLIRLRFKKLGGHFHCRLFTAPGPTLTFAKAGDLVFDEREWPDVAAILESRQVQVIPEDGHDTNGDREPFNANEKKMEGWFDDANTRTVPTFGEASDD